MKFCVIALFFIGCTVPAAISDDIGSILPGIVTALVPVSTPNGGKYSNFIH